MVTLCFHPQQNNTNWANCVCSSIPSDARQLGRHSYHIYEAKEFTRDFQEAAVTGTFKQELKAETLLCRHQKLVQSIEFGMYVYGIYWTRLLFIAFFTFGLLGIFLHFWKALLATAVGFLVSSHRFIASAYIGNTVWSWCMLWKLIPRNLTRTMKYY